MSAVQRETDSDGPAPERLRLLVGSGGAGVILPSLSVYSHEKERKISMRAGHRPESGPALDASSVP